MGADLPLPRHDPQGRFGAESDDFGGSPTRRLTVVAQQAGTPDLNAGALPGRPAESRRGRAPPVSPRALLVDCLTDGDRHETGQAACALDLARDQVLTVDLSALASDGRRPALATWSSVAHPKFCQVRKAAQITSTKDGFAVQNGAGLSD